MAVKIPRLERIQPSKALPQNTRVNVKAQDNAQDILNRGNAITSLGETGIKVYEKYEDKKIDELSYKAELEFTPWYDQKLKEVQQIKDKDPTEIYKNFEVEIEEKYNDILNKNPNLSGRVQRGLAGKFERVKDAKYLQMLNQRGAQVETYKNNLDVAIKKTKKNEIAASAGNIQILGEHVKDLEDIVKKRAVETGGAIQLYDKQGNEVEIKLNEIGQSNLKKEMNEGISAAINAAIDSGQKDQAMLVYGKYKQYLEPKEEAAFLKKVESKKVDDDAYKEVGKIERLPINEQEAALKKIKDEKVKTKAIQIKHDRDTDLRLMRENKENANFDVAAKEIYNMRQSGQPITMTRVESNPKIKNIWDNLSAKQQQAIRETVISPKFNDEKVLNKALELLNDNDPNVKLQDITEVKFQEYLVGLTESKKRELNKRFLKRNGKTQNAGSRNAQFNAVSKMLKQKLIAKKIIPPTELSEKQYIKLNKAYDDLQMSMDEFSTDESIEKISAKLDEYVALKKKGELFGTGNPWSDEAVAARKAEANRPGLFDRFTSLFSDKPTPEQVANNIEIENTKEDYSKVLKDKNALEIAKLQFKFKQQSKSKNTPKVTDKVFLKWVKGQSK